MAGLLDSQQKKMMAQVNQSIPLQKDYGALLTQSPDAIFAQLLQQEDESKAAQQAALEEQLLKRRAEAQSGIDLSPTAQLIDSTFGTNISPAFAAEQKAQLARQDDLADLELELAKGGGGASALNKVASYKAQQARADEARALMAPQKFFENLPEDSKQTITSLAKKNADREAIANSIESVFAGWDTLTEPQKLQQGRQLIKTLNSTMGSDAAGAEEVKRLASKLEIAFSGFTTGNPGQFGRDIEGFKEDALITSKGIRDSINANKAVIDKAYMRPVKAEAQKPGGGGYPKTVRNGAQVATVSSPEEEAEAAAEGFK